MRLGLHVKNDAETIVDAFYAAWRARDTEAGLSYFTDDIHVVFHFGPALLFSGESRGKAAAREKMSQSEADWEFLQLRPVYRHVSPDLVRCSCPFIFRHVRTGALMEGTLRHVFTLRDSRISKFEAFVDIALVKSFLRMIGLRTASI